MCGISGLVSKNRINEKDIDLIRKMNFIQRHRGPDDEGIFHNDYCVLGHRRLSIIDLSKDGHQPFSSDDGRYCMVFNGEIYNYIELKNELISKGIKFHTKTDTEVLLKMYIHYGAACLHKLNGMFAFAIFDTKSQEIFIARDRIGIKPLYYTIIHKKLYFASEIKALRIIPELSHSVNKQAISDYLIFNRTDIHDETFISDIKRLPKGHYAHYDGENLSITKYWDAINFLEKNNAISLVTACDKINELFTQAVTLRMRSDVPVGSCLSGGLDSSIITGLLYEKKMVSNNYSTFTSSFPGHPIDETAYIDKLNQKYDFQNFRCYPNSSDAFHEFEQFIFANDEPVFNSSFYSQYRVMKLAKENKITVLLDGQGGDENFAGYQYFHGFFLRELIAKSDYTKFLSELYKVWRRNQDKSAFQTLVFQLINDHHRKKLLYKTLPYLKREFFYEHINQSKIFNDFFDARDLNTSLVRHFQYKLEHLLRMEDRNSMAFSIEARVPYLDHRLVEYILSLPTHIKIKAGQTKFLQIEALGRYTIPDILNRKDKIGFGTPRDEWMNSKEWVSFTYDNLNVLKNSFPEIFNKNYTIPSKGIERWKLNALATWNNLKWD